jgi:hypothetical protein
VDDAVSTDEVHGDWTEATENHCFHFFAWRANFRGFVDTIPGENMGRFFEGMVGAPLGKMRGPDGFRDAGRRHRFFRFARHWDTCRVEEMDRFEGA